MRIAAFIPAVLALTLFSATQAAPTSNSIALLKRGRPDVDAKVNAFVDLHTKLIADVCIDASADICADLDLTVVADADVLNGLITAKANVDKIRVSLKAKADAVVKAKIDAEVKVKATAKVRATVEQEILTLCPLLGAACIEKNAEAIVANVNAKIFVHLKKLVATVKAKVEAHLRLRVKAMVEEVKVNLGLANVKVTARIWIASNVNVVVKIWVDVWAKLCAKININALIKAL